MTKTRTFLAVFIGGFWALLASAALDRDWPDYSATMWFVFVAGLVVIALFVVALESYLARRRRSHA